MSAAKRHIVIVGGGFAGIYALRTLQKLIRPSDRAEVTLISRDDAFVFIPMIHEVATGLLRPDSITMPLRAFENKHVRDIVRGVVRRVDYDKKIVIVDRTDGAGYEIAYDMLLIATGSATAFMGVPGAAEHAYPLRMLDDAKRIRNRMLDAFDRADECATEDACAAHARFVVVGGGATGVEMAAEIAECLCGEIPRLFPRLKGRGEVVLINRGERLLAEGDAWFSRHAEQALARTGCVRLMHTTSVESVDSTGVVTDKGPIQAGTVIWCAGVEASVPSASAAVAPNADARSKRLHVAPDLSLQGYPDVFVAGDAAAVLDPTTGKPYAMRAQFAARQGTHAARSMLARIRGTVPEPFAFRERGFLVSLGSSACIARVGPFRFSGRTAWIIYHIAYINALIGIRAKLRTLLDWTMNLFGRRDLGRV